MTSICGGEWVERELTVAAAPLHTSSRVIKKNGNLLAKKLSFTRFLENLKLTKLLSEVTHNKTAEVTYIECREKKLNFLQNFKFQVFECYIYEIQDIILDSVPNL